MADKTLDAVRIIDKLDDVTDGVRLLEKADDLVDGARVLENAIPPVPEELGKVVNKKTKKFYRSKSERKKALLRDAKDPNSGLSDRARKQILDSKGKKVPKGYEVSHEKPLYNAKTVEGKKTLDNMDNMKTQQKSKHRKRHKKCGDQYHKFGPANKPNFYFEDIKF